MSTCGFKRCSYFHSDERFVLNDEDPKPTQRREFHDGTIAWQSASARGKVAYLVAAAMSRAVDQSSAPQQA
jgi:hypothetical protein